MEKIIAELTHQPKLWSREQVLAKPCPVPAQPGIYAWYFRELPGCVDPTGCLTCGDLTLLYIGISPKAPPRNGRSASRENLRKRIRYHFRGNAEGSTLRLTLGCLLADPLGIHLRIDQNAHHCFCSKLREIRSGARKTAQQLPVLEH